MTVLTPGRTTDPAQPGSQPALRALLLLVGCSLAVFLAVGLLVHWRVTGQFDPWLLGLVGSPKGSRAARPPSVHWASTAQGFAFPSRHATTATAGYIVLAVLISELVPTARRRRTVRGAGIAVAFLVGASRIVLAVHWPTDVIAGWALGTAVAAATLALTQRPTGSGPSGHRAPPATEPPR